MAPHFWNVDLDIESKADLSELKAELGRNVCVIDGGPVSPGCSLLRLETAIQYKSADDTILAFCSLIEELSPNARRAWRRAHKKEFDIGHDIAKSRRYSQFSLRAETLKRMSNLGATLGITIYNPSFVSPARRRRANQSK